MKCSVQWCSAVCTIPYMQIMCTQQLISDQVSVQLFSMFMCLWEETASESACVHPNTEVVSASRLQSENHPMVRVAVVFDNPSGPPQAPAGEHVLQGGKVNSHVGLGSLYNSLQVLGSKTVQVQNQQIMLLVKLLKSAVIEQHQDTGPQTELHI